MYGCGIQLGKISHFIMKTFFSSSLGENEPMSRRISSIEGFRVLAILGVILWHTDLLLRLRQLGGGRWPVDVTINMVWWVEFALLFYRGWLFLREISRRRKENPSVIFAAMPRLFSGYSSPGYVSIQ